MTKLNKNELTMSQIKALFLEDLDKEEAFRKALGKDKLRLDIRDEIFWMLKVYDEQLENYIRNRIDVEFHRVMLKLEPNNQETQQLLTKSDKYRKETRLLIEVIRSQILVLLGKNNL